RPIGQGGMAVVYRAIDRRDGRAVALKILRESYSGDARAIARFLREARASAALRHPNVIEVYDTGELEGRHYIAMELVDGPDLRDHLERHGALPSPEAV